MLYTTLPAYFSFCCHTVSWPFLAHEPRLYHMKCYSGGMDAQGVYHRVKHPMTCLRVAFRVLCRYSYHDAGSAVASKV